MIFGDSHNVLDQLLFKTNPENESWIKNQLNFDALGSICQDFKTHAQNIYERLNNTKAINFAKNLIRQHANVLDASAISELYDIENLRQASPLMQRYIMANPKLRKKYNEQLCDGYSDSYVDVDPGTIGKDHYDFRRVTNSMVMVNDDTWEAVNYMEDLIKDDVELEFLEKTSILNTWDAVEHFIDLGEDITDINGGKIG